MPKSRYTNSFVQTTPIVFGSKQPSQYGVLLSEYDVREYWDLRTSSSNSGARRAYSVALKQKVSICNSTANSFGALNPVTSYDGYPILLAQQVTPATAAQGLEYYLEDYSPKTLNAAVSTSNSSGTNSSAASSLEHTSGSTYSVTNSYEISDSIGFFGADPTGNTSFSAGHSETSTTEQSTSSGQTTSQGSEAGTGSSMTIKDWASYAFLDAKKQQPAWVWGQEYPWDVIAFRNLSKDSHSITLPPYVSVRLCDGTTIFPPSDISQFGLNFTANARWIFYVDGAAGAADETVTFTHVLSYWEGTHSSGPPSIAIIASNQAIETVTLNLPVLALDPIARAGSGNGAVIGFVKSEFIAPPAGNQAPFRVKSGANNIYVSGTGFEAPSTEDSVLTAGKISASVPASLTIQFKMTSADLELSLYLKHWKLSSTGCVMTFAINEADPQNPTTPIARHIDSFDAGSGGDNITTITLRKKDYTSTDFYDYLVMGLNTIVVTIAPEDRQATCDYALRALAIS